MLKSASALAALVFLASAAPPPVGPVPEEKPAQEQAPAPEAKPETPETGMPDAPPAAQAPVPEEKPVLEEKPETSGKDDAGARQEPENAEELSACIKTLEESGAVFRTLPRQSGPGACGIENPIELSEPAPGLRLDPPAVLRCAAALSVVEWTREIAVPVARKAFPGKRITALSNASSYVCRNRNTEQTGKVSEHARGNAIDISAVTFSDGETLTMKPRREDGDMAGAFQRSLTASACLYFTTVLSPGSDATHQDHLHLDIIERKNGYRYCR
ncbi:extensin family protein [Rhizobiaceae bacterium BDR2-2]|uniref:Extensin family protein n=1 Tax=Ectorhizobium quercum TaxID=2965071 RepID=A0AAE3MWK6_9HYPH|nr:extensin family protein [Ectorhizobium quercum]MCX8996618.1 extensin family protein [Ectorhizobium quercum]